MAKPLGTKHLRVRQVESGEWGVWRVNESNCPYVLLTDPDLDTAVEICKKIGKALNLAIKIDKSRLY